MSFHLSVIIIFIFSLDEVIPVQFMVMMIMLTKKVLIIKNLILFYDNAFNELEIYFIWYQKILARFHTVAWLNTSHGYLA